MIKPHTYSKKYDESSSSKTDPAVVASAFGLPPPTNEDVNVRLTQIDDMKLFFATATHNWDPSKSVRKFPLPGGENVACVLWNDLFFISGTDIVRSLNFRFHAFGRPVTNAKKFEEGIFSDLRNLKPGHDARLEEPKSELLDMLYKNNCIRTQKKQKVFYWFSVPHDRLFLDALERDLKREKMGMEPTTKAVAEPATSISLDSTQELFDQLRRNMSKSILSPDTFSPKKDEQKRGSRSPKLNSSTLISSKVTHPKLSLEDHTSNWSPTQSRLERAAAQAKRARVNSVPANLGKQQQSQLLHQQRYHRLSHGSYFAGDTMPSSSVTRLRSGRVIPSSTTSSLLSTTTTSSSSTPADDSFRDDLSHCSSTTALTDISKSTSMLSCHSNQQPDYMDPISEGVNDLDITATISSNTIQSTRHSFDQQRTSPSKSVDPIGIKKNKTIFGTLSLFDGSPSYKQRRRRATSVSMSAHSNTNQLQTLYAPAGRPERLRRHQPQQHEIRTNTANPVVTLPQLSHSLNNMNNHSTSRLALAAAKAGFVSGSQLMATPTSSPTSYMPVISTSIHPGHSWSTTPQPYFQVQQQQQQGFYCPVIDCRHSFKRPDHLEHHIQAVHMSVVCALCGKQFPQSDILAQHHRLEHEIQQYEYTPPTSSFLNDNDDDSSPDINQPYQRGLLHPNSQGNGVYNTTSQPYLHQEQTSQQQGGSQGDNAHSTHRPSFDSVRSLPTALTAADIAPAAAAMAVAAAAVASNNSTCSTLSPILDVDYDMSDIEQSQVAQVQPHPASTSNAPISTTNPPFIAMAHSGSTTSVLMNSNNDFMNNTLFSAIQTGAPPMPSSRSSSISSSHRMLKRNINSSPMEDDLTSSSASSPSSTFQFGGSNNSTSMYTTGKNDPFIASKSIAPLTLLSPFKPEQYQQMNVQSDEDADIRQQPKSDLALLGPSGVNDTAFMLNTYQQQQQQQRHYNLSQPIFGENTMLMSTSNNNFDSHTSVAVVPTSLLNDSTSLYAPYMDPQHPQQHYSTPFIGLGDMDTLVFGA